MNLTLNVYHDVRRGGRNYMEDVIAIVTHIGDQSQPNSHPFVCFLVFDGHGGVEAAKFSEENLLNEIKGQEGFNSDDDELVVEAIKKGFLSTHQLMWKVIGTWPKTQHGLASTSGTTVSMVLVRKGKLYVAHVGDSTVMLAEQGNADLTWKARVLTTDHKPDLPQERQRIERSGGEVMLKSGVPRVVWRRERSIKLPNKKVSSKDCVPFLAVARSLGDLWSYNETTEMYSVSPEPDVSVHEIDLSQLKCLVLASDGLWNVLSAAETTKTIMKCLNVAHQSQSRNDSFWLNVLSYDEVIELTTKDPATALIDMVMVRCRNRYLRADNTSVIVVLFEEDKSEHADKDHLVKSNSWNINVNNLSKSNSPTPQILDENNKVAISSSDVGSTNCLTKTPVIDTLCHSYFGKNDKMLNNHGNLNSGNVALQLNAKIVSLPQISSFVKIKNLNESVTSSSCISPSIVSDNSLKMDKFPISDEPNCASTNISNDNDRLDVDAFSLFEICKSASENEDTSLFGDNIIPQVPVCFINNKDSTVSASSPPKESNLKSVSDEEVNSSRSKVSSKKESAQFSLLNSFSSENKALFKITHPLETCIRSSYTNLKKRKFGTDNETSDSVENKHSDDNAGLEPEVDSADKIRSDSPSSDQDADGDDFADERLNKFVGVRGENSLSSGLKSTLKSVSSTVRRKLYSNYISRQHRKLKPKSTLAAASHLRDSRDSLTDFVKVCKSRLQLRRIQVCS